MFGPTSHSSSEISGALPSACSNLSSASSLPSLPGARAASPSLPSLPSMANGLGGGLPRRGLRRRGRGPGRGAFHEKGRARRGARCEVRAASCVLPNSGARNLEFEIREWLTWTTRRAVFISLPNGVREGMEASPRFRPGLPGTFPLPPRYSRQKNSLPSAPPGAARRAEPRQRAPRAPDLPPGTARREGRRKASKARERQPAARLPCRRRSA